MISPSQAGLDSLTQDGNELAIRCFESMARAFHPYGYKSLPPFGTWLVASFLSS